METDRVELGMRVLAVFRILIGFLLLWAFMDKMFGLGFKTPSGFGMIDGGSPSSFVVYTTSGFFADFYNSLAGNQIADILLMAGLLILGITLILGIASKLTTVFACLFFLVMYTIHVPPEDDPILDFRIILAVGLVGTYLIGGYDRYSLGSRWKELSLVKRFPLLE